MSVYNSKNIQFVNPSKRVPDGYAKCRTSIEVKNPCLAVAPVATGSIRQIDPFLKNKANMPAFRAPAGSALTSGRKSEIGTLQIHVHSWSI